MIHISITAEPIYQLGPLTVTNSMLATWLTLGILLSLALIARRGIGLVPRTKFANFTEMLIEGMYNMTYSIVGSKNKSRQFFALSITLFLFIIVSNWVGLLPGVGTIMLRSTVDPSQIETTQEKTDLLGIDNIEVHDSAGKGSVVATGETDTHNLTVEAELAPGAEASHEKATPILRAPTADLNTTLALALVAVAFIQYYAIKNVGMKPYLKKFFNFSSAILFFVGILELISEFAKIISFGFRLFGNIFAGEVLLVVIGFLLPIIGPIPFFAMEIFVGFIQAIVFSMLTIVFLSVATEEHH